MARLRTAVRTVVAALLTILPRGRGFRSTPPPSRLMPTWNPSSDCSRRRRRLVGEARTTSTTPRKRKSAATRIRSVGSDDAANVDSARKGIPAVYSTKAAFDAAVLNRYACKKFQRSDGTPETGTNATQPDLTTVQQALWCLDLARQAPSAYNFQPYRLLLVHDPSQREAMSKYCLGPNARRVLDADCTVVFLADRQACKTFPLYRSFVADERRRNGKAVDNMVLRKTLFYVTIFSSGYPLPRILAAVTSFAFRTAMAFLNLFTSWFYPLPTLASSETWAAKQTLMVAMTYLLACTSRGLATIPMEGINASGLRKVLRIPSRYAIPLIVCTGTAHQGDDSDDEKELRLERAAHRRYPFRDVVFGNTFGAPAELASIPS